MPFIIAGILYAFLAFVASTVVVGICLVQHRRPGRSTLGGGIGSLAGFLLGCIAGASICIAVPIIGMRIGATAVVVIASLSAALLGMVIGAAASRRTT